MQFIVFQYIVSHWNSFLSDGRKAFTSFLKSEYSQENIEFWEACEDFKQTSVDEMNVNARKIFERYVEAIPLARWEHCLTGIYLFPYHI